MASFLRFGCGQLAMLAALGIFAGSPASAADLGGNCCADLEERIAELEATTVRKGNRKVKLEVSGQVNEALLFWDDGVESNVGAYTNDNARTRFRFKGEAKIDADTKAGYLLEIGVRSSRSNSFTQDDDNGTGLGLDLRHSTWYIDSKKYGRVWVGLTGGASEGVTEVNLAATKDVLKYSDQEDAGLGLLSLDGGVSTGVAWRNLIRGGGDAPGEGRRHNLVRYDTPELAGFVGTVNWGEDDGWEVGVRYKGEFADFKLAAAIAYGETTDGTGQAVFQCVGDGAVPAVVGPPAVPAIPANGKNDRDCEQLGGSVSVMHSPTGIYVNFGAGYMEDSLIGTDPGLSAAERLASDDRSTFYAGELGIEQKFNSLGKTTFFVQYYKNEGGTQDRTVTTAAFGSDDLLGSELEAYGIGVIQGVDAAAMHVYLNYRHYEGEVSQLAGSTDLDDLDVVMGGAIIRF